MEQTFKICTVCGIEKQLEEFWHHKNMKHGRYSSCIDCCKEKSKQRYIDNKEQRNTHSKENYQQNKERYLLQSKERYQLKKEEIIENVQEWVKENPVKAKTNWRSSQLRRKYGITLEQFDALLEKQNHKCAICEKPADKQKSNFHVDHAHTSSDFIPEGMIRGLLCWDCNLKLIGKRTNPILFERAAEYLKQHTGWMVPNDHIKPKRRRKRRHK